MLLFTVHGKTEYCTVLYNKDRVRYPPTFDFFVAFSETRFTLLLLVRTTNLCR